MPRNLVVYHVSNRKAESFKLERNGPRVQHREGTQVFKVGQINLVA